MNANGNELVRWLNGFFLQDIVKHEFFGFLNDLLLMKSAHEIKDLFLINKQSILSMQDILKCEFDNMLEDFSVQETREDKIICHIKDLFKMCTCLNVNERPIFAQVSLRLKITFFLRCVNLMIVLLEEVKYSTFSVFKKL